MFTPLENARAALIIYRERSRVRATEDTEATDTRHV